MTTAVELVTGTPGEQTRARYPDAEGVLERDGVRISYEVYGSGEPTVLLLPTWSIVHSRLWKMQVPYLARHCRVVTFDGRGNGRSDRPEAADAYSADEFARDALAVMDATSTRRAALACESSGAKWALLLAAEHPELVERVAFISSSLPLGARAEATWFDRPLERYEGWAKFNRHYWLEHYRDFLDFFFAQCFTEPHSTKQIEDCVGWALETSPETLVATLSADERVHDADTVSELAARIRCPVLVIHGVDDAVRPVAHARELARLTGGRLVELEGSGHVPEARDPVKVNLLLRDFVLPPPPTLRWPRARARRKRALYVSSPIGLGHAQRDVAIADELRKLHPELEVDWLAQHPVTAVLEARGERVHPASAMLASESGHMESESGEHHLHCFYAWRRMDEILLANFMVFHDLVREEQYDLWIGDEAWDVDYYLHENPEQKTAAYVWLTDFVGWLPMPEGGEREVFLTADHNAEKLELIERFPRVRDRALFVGSLEDVTPEHFGPGLPFIPDWTKEHFSFPGYVTGFDPAALADRPALRARLGYREDERVCVVTVGGSGVGGDLLRRVIGAFPEAKERVPELRMVVVAGPRIDPRSLPSHEGLEVRAYVHELYRHLAACDLAVVQGGLTTTMELTANRRPFLYFPLRHHFEQNFHVRHRLERHRAGRCMDYATTTETDVAAAIAEGSVARSTTGRWRRTGLCVPRR